MHNVYYASIGGIKYPLVFSLGAKKQLRQIKSSLKFLQNYKSKITNKKEEKREIVEEDFDASYEAIDTMSTIAEIMISQGVAYCNKFLKHNAPPDKKCSYDKGHWHGISKEDIELVITDKELKELQKVVKMAFSSSNGNIHTKPKTQSKNRQATQGKHR